MMPKYTPKTTEELKDLVKDEAIHLGDIDTSNIVYMYYLFAYSDRKDFNGIEKWNVSNVENMVAMFTNAAFFNQDISSWDVSNVENMSGMFADATSFNQPLNDWNVSKVRDMSYMFAYAESFNQPLNEWDVGNVRNMENMFRNALSFNQDISSWDVSNVRDKTDMFYGAESFNSSITCKETMIEVAKILRLSKEEWLGLRNYNEALDALREEAKKIIKKEKQKERHGK